MFVLKHAVERTGARLARLYDTLKEEYWRTHDYFEDYGYSLSLKEVNKRGVVSAMWASVFIFCVTLPVIVYHRGISEPSLFVGLAVIFGITWMLFYVLVFAAHFLWILSFIAGSRVGGSDMFLNYVGKRWGRRIDEIANTFVAEKTIVTVQKSENCDECDTADTTKINSKSIENESVNDNAIKT